MTSIKNTLTAAVERKRLFPSDIEAAIDSEHYFTAADGQRGAGGVDVSGLGDPLSLLTFCVLVLHNGTKVVGINYGAIDPAQHSAERGREEAAKDARNKVWELLGYALREQMSAAKSSVSD